jgi:hypothetical protein
MNHENQAARRALVTITSLSAIVMGIAACSADASPSTGSYTVNFPSVAAAVATDGVQVFVFDAKGTDSSSLCAELLLKVKSNQDLGVKQVTGPTQTPCDLAAGSSPITIPYGNKALLAVGTSGGVTLLAGCTQETVGAGSLPVSISLGIVNTTASVGTTTCTRLSDFCSQKCK